MISALPNAQSARALTSAIDLRVGLFTAALALATAVVFSLAPAWQA